MKRLILLLLLLSCEDKYLTVERRVIDAENNIPIYFTTTAEQSQMESTWQPVFHYYIFSFDKEGRGSRRDIDLDLHRDGDYSTEYKNKIDIVGLYCIRPGVSKTIIEHKDKELFEIVLKKGQALIFDNKICRHGRVGLVKDRILLRVWISKE